MQPWAATATAISSCIRSTLININFSFNYLSLLTYRNLGNLFIITLELQALRWISRSRHHIPLHCPVRPFYMNTLSYIQSKRTTDSVCILYFHQRKVTNSSTSWSCPSCPRISHFFHIKPEHATWTWTGSKATHGEWEGVIGVSVRGLQFSSPHFKMAQIKRFVRSFGNQNSPKRWNSSETISIHHFNQKK